MLEIVKLPFLLAVLANPPLDTASLRIAPSVFPPREFLFGPSAEVQRIEKNTHWVGVALKGLHKPGPGSFKPHQIRPGAMKPHVDGRSGLLAKSARELEAYFFGPPSEATSSR